MTDTGEKPQQDTTSKTAREVLDRTTVLVSATEVLSNRVRSLADVVQINNRKIDSLQKEVQCKPDDVEVKLIAGLARQHRKRLFSNILMLAFSIALIAGAVSFAVANYKGQQRCKVNQQNIASIVALLEEVNRPEFDKTIADLRSNRNEC